MSSSIQDGTGTSKRAKVSNSNKLVTVSETYTAEFQAVLDGRGYNINTDTINLTSGGTESGVLYIKYTGTKKLVLNGFVYLLGSDTGGAADEDHRVDVYRNPTTGTLISSGTEITPVNRNFGSARTLVGTVLKGADSSTITNGTICISSLFSSVGRQAVPVSVVLTPNTAAAVSVTPKASTTSMNIQIAVATYETEE